MTRPSSVSSEARIPLGTPCPRLWPGETFVVLGCGPSLTLDDVDHARNWDGTRIIAINDSWQMTFADVLYAADAEWWKGIADVPDEDLPPHLFSIDPVCREHRPSLHVLSYMRGHALSFNQTQLASGGHSGHQAVNLSVHLGAAKIILLGFDMQPNAAGEHHYFGDRPDGRHPTYASRLPAFRSLKASLDEIGIPIFNASRETAIDCLPRLALADALRA